jgi:AcrR family transcriptional regulator
MALLRTSRSAWIEAGVRALAEGGPEAVRVEGLAESLGVTKGGFYGQFSDREELLRDMLDSWATAAVDQVIDEVEQGGGDARAKLQRLFEIAKVERTELLKTELAIRDWARRDTGAADRVHRVDERRMEYMRTLFSQICEDDGIVEARCLLAFSLFIGSHFVVAGHGERTRDEVLDLAVAQLMA